MKFDDKNRIESAVTTWRLRDGSKKVMRTLTTKKTFFKNGTAKESTKPIEMRIVHLNVPVQIGREAFLCEFRETDDSDSGEKVQEWATSKVPGGFAKRRYIYAAPCPQPGEYSEQIVNISRKSTSRTPL